MVLILPIFFPQSRFEKKEKSIKRTINYGEYLYQDWRQDLPERGPSFTTEGLATRRPNEGDGLPKGYRKLLLSIEENMKMLALFLESVIWVFREVK